MYRLWEKTTREPATVSRVLNGRSVAPETAERVKRAIEDSGYVPNFAGRNLRTKQTNKILLLIPSIQNTFYSEIVNVFEAEVWKEGFCTLFGITNRNAEVEKQYLELLYAKQVDGLACFMPTIGETEICEIADKYPFVAMGWNGFDHLNANIVTIDHARASYDITKYVIKLGHTRIALMNGDTKNYEWERDKGARLAMSEAGIVFDENYYVSCEDTYEDGYRACGRLMSMPVPPTSILTLSDRRAVGALRWLREHGMEAGKDVDITGFDNIDISGLVYPGITTVAQPRVDLGVEGAKVLIGQIRDKEQSLRSIILSHRIVPRQTTHRICP